jgi:hypothetical protein
MNPMRFAYGLCGSLQGQAGAKPNYDALLRLEK